MTKYNLSTLDEIDLLDKQYSQEYHRTYANIKNRVGNIGGVVFCYYAITKQPKGLWGRGDDLKMIILTDTKIIYTNMFAERIWEIKLKDIIDVKPEMGFLFNKGGGVSVVHRISSYSIQSENTIHQDSSSSILFGENEDEALQNQIIGEIQLASANSTNPSYAQIQNIKNQQSHQQDSIANQLEKLAELYKSGILTDEEFKKAKNQILSK
jgi:hypothetical protein